VDRPVQAVQVKAVKSGLGPLVAAGPVVVPVQPSDEIQHRRVLPHPGRETLEAAQRLLGGRVLAAAADVPVDPVGIGPVRLGRDRAESSFLDQPACHLRPRRVELTGAVGSLADQHEVRVADQIEQHIVGRRSFGHRHRLGPDGGYLRRTGPASGSRPGPRGRAKEVPDLFVGGLGEVPVGLPDREERRRRGGADHLVGQRIELPAGRLGRGRHGDHDRGGPQPP